VCSLPKDPSSSSRPTGDRKGTSDMLQNSLEARSSQTISAPGRSSRSRVQSIARGSTIAQASSRFQLARRRVPLTIHPVGGALRQRDRSRCRVAREDARLLCPLYAGAVVSDRCLRRQVRLVASAAAGGTHGRLGAGRAAARHRRVAFPWPWGAGGRPDATRPLPRWTIWKCPSGAGTCSAGGGS
jgi:hypothetical protein